MLIKISKLMSKIAFRIENCNIASHSQEIRHKPRELNVGTNLESQAYERNYPNSFHLQFKKKNLAHEIKIKKWTLLTIFMHTFFMNGGGGGHPGDLKSERRD